MPQSGTVTGDATTTAADGVPPDDFFCPRSQRTAWRVVRARTGSGAGVG